jgi:hypothetical protein
MQLHDIGLKRAERWLADHLDMVGVASTVEFGPSICDPPVASVSNTTGNG